MLNMFHLSLSRDFRVKQVMIVPKNTFFICFPNGQYSIRKSFTPPRLSEISKKNWSTKAQRHRNYDTNSC